MGNTPKGRGSSGLARRRRGVAPLSRARHRGGCSGAGALVSIGIIRPGGVPWIDARARVPRCMTRLFFSWSLFYGR